MPSARTRTATSTHSSPRSAREAALDHLTGEKGQGDANASDDLRFRRQTQEYIHGITRQQRWLNHIIDENYTGKRELDEKVRTIIQIGLYDFLFLSTPDYAAIDAAVNLARDLVGNKVTGLVNAIMRNVQRGQIPVPETGNIVSDLAVRYSHPDWMVERWVDRYGVESTEAFLKFNNTRPTYCLRVNMLKTTRDEVRSQLEALDVEAVDARYSSDFLYCDQLQGVLHSDLFTSGLVTIQDESAGLIVDIADPREGQVIVDLCAAPGGKTSGMMEKAGGKATLYAVDRSAGRLQKVQETITRLGLPSVSLIEADATEATLVARLPEADLVLVDAPCSGLGVLSRRADLRWRRTEEQIAEMITLQDSLLDSAAKITRPGGVLVYSTCTIEPDENEHRVSRFLDSRKDFSVEDCRPFLASDELVSDGIYQTLPFRHGIDGAFAVRLRRDS